MKRAPVISEQLCDIQAMLSSGFGWLTESRFWLLTIADEQEKRARAWLSQLVESEMLVSAKRVLEDNKKSSIVEAVAIAFSYAGLKKLGVGETHRHPFPTAFRDGMGSDLRKSLLRDVPRDGWKWSDARDCAGRQTVHVVVANWRSPDATWETLAPDEEAFCTIRIVKNWPRAFRKDKKLYEPFGFRDGVAQPVIRGLRQEDGENPKRVRLEAGPMYEDRVVNPGEFVLGYQNEYNELTYSPNVEHWTEFGRATHPGGRFTLNGSYLAVRQIEQNVEAFKAFERKFGEGVCEKLMGRRRNALPLSWKGNPKVAVSDSRADAFRYKVEDANGFVCPKGAHIRRMNPRDSLGLDVKSGIQSSKLHRLLRRGRPYLDEAENKLGLFFIACNADLERQFELIHQRWMRNPRFGNLHDEDDPVVGSPGPPKTFTIPGLPSGDEVFLDALTQTIGGGYFFLPGIEALKFIVAGEGRTDLCALR